MSLLPISAFRVLSKPGGVRKSSCWQTEARVMIRVVMQLRGPATAVVTLYLHLSEAIVGHFVHEAVEQGGGASFVHSELSLGGEVVTFLDLEVR